MDFVTMNIGAGDWGRQGDFSTKVTEEIKRVVQIFKEKAALCCSRSAVDGDKCG